jgi:hypothetical protein
MKKKFLASILSSVLIVFATIPTVVVSAACKCTCRLTCAGTCAYQCSGCSLSEVVDAAAACCDNNPAGPGPCGEEENY